MPLEEQLTASSSGEDSSVRSQDQTKMQWLQSIQMPVSNGCMTFATAAIAPTTYTAGPIPSYIPYFNTIPNPNSILQPNPNPSAYHILNPQGNYVRHCHPLLSETLWPQQLLSKRMSEYLAENQSNDSPSSKTKAKERPDVSQCRHLIDPGVGSREDIVLTEKESPDEQMQVIKIEELDNDGLPESEDAEIQGCLEFGRTTNSRNEEEFSQATSQRQTPIDNFQSLELKEPNEELCEEGWQIKSPCPRHNLADPDNVHHSDRMKSDDHSELTSYGFSSEDPLVSILPVTHIKEENAEQCWRSESNGATQCSGNRGDVQLEVMKSINNDDLLSVGESLKGNYGISWPMIEIKQELRDSD